MKTFLDTDGRVLEGSISERVYLDVGDARLGMIIQAKDETAPVIMFLGGGIVIHS